MNGGRLVALVVGTAGAGAAGTAVLVPSAVDTIPIAQAVRFAGNDYLLVVPIGVLSLVGAAVVIATRLRQGVADTTPPPVEQQVHPRPGTSIDAALDSLPPFRATDRHVRLHRELRELAMAGLVHRRDCSRNEAARRLQGGTWTDNRLAGEFLSGEPFTPPSLTTRIRERARGRHWFEARVAASIAAITALEAEDGT